MTPRQELTCQAIRYTSSLIVGIPHFPLIGIGLEDNACD
jgi:hypothetical protein